MTRAALLALALSGCAVGTGAHAPDDASECPEAPEERPSEPEADPWACTRPDGAWDALVRRHGSDTQLLTRLVFGADPAAPCLDDGTRTSTTYLESWDSSTCAYTSEVTCTYEGGARIVTLAHELYVLAPGVLEGTATVQWVINGEELDPDAYIISEGAQQSAPPSLQSDD